MQSREIDTHFTDTLTKLTLRLLYHVPSQRMDACLPLVIYTVEAQNNRCYIALGDSAADMLFSAKNPPLISY